LCAYNSAVDGASHRDAGDNGVCRFVDSVLMAPGSAVITGKLYRAARPFADGPWINLPGRLPPVDGCGHPVGRPAANFFPHSRTALYSWARSVVRIERLDRIFSNGSNSWRVYFPTRLAGLDSR